MRLTHWSKASRARASRADRTVESITGSSFWVFPDSVHAFAGKGKGGLRQGCARLRISCAFSIFMRRNAAGDGCTGPPRFLAGEPLKKGRGYGIMKLAKKPDSKKEEGI